MNVELVSLPQTAALAAKLNWFHSIDFGDGFVTNGVTPYSILKSHADLYFSGIVKDKSVLDIGCWDGFNSIEAIRAGARRVLATDHFAWSEQGWGDRRAFDLARATLAPSIEVMDIDVAELTEERIGKFDVVLFAGVFYHLRNPFLTLEHVSRLATEWLIVETHLDAMNIDRPAMIFYPTTELGNDMSNWWGPNRTCVEAMLRDCGFPYVEFLTNPRNPNRGIFRARRSS